MVICYRFVCLTLPRDQDAERQRPRNREFLIEPGAFETARANPKTCLQRDATSPAPSQR
ncbi:hypothetical protein F4802DRAFT_545066 [Xylaria palmicola]|nr:hypothetical protein F4802DRAFT_545066 [Xylaria palmicola]